MNMEKTYDALLSRLVLSYAHFEESVKDLERQPNLNESEKQCIIERKAVAEHLKRIIDIEQKKEDREGLTHEDFMRMAENIYNAALDMDFGDYIDTREEDIDRLTAALENLNMHDENECVLLQALERIYS